MKRNLISLLCAFLSIIIMAQNPSELPNLTTNKGDNKGSMMMVEHSLKNQCRLKFEYYGLASTQSSHSDYMVYEVPGTSASELKASVINTFSFMHHSPEDVVTNLSDNMIQLEAYMPNVFYRKAGTSSYPIDFIFVWTIQFKDGKIRINVPKAKAMWATKVPMRRTLKYDISKPLSTLVDDSLERKELIRKLNDFIKTICDNVTSANDW